MKFEIEIPDYDPTLGLQTEWDSHYFLKTNMNQDEFLISADAEALREIAIHLLTLSQKAVPIGTHIHYDSWTYPMADGSIHFIIEKV